MDPLTKQENNIAELIAFGFSEKEISSKLFIAESTVHTHARNIRRKIDARSAVDVARFYILENPKKFFVAVFFLLLQSFMMFHGQHYEMRKPLTARTVRTAKTRRNEHC